MQVIPLKAKYQLTERDIDDLSRLLAEGSSLAHMAYFFENRLSAEQIFIMGGVLAKEMYDMPLDELCPHLVEERRQMNSGKGDQWQKKKQDVNMLQLLKDLAEDLNLYENELVSAARA